MNIFETVESQIKSLLEGESNFICNASNFAAAIFNSFNRLNWVGFYFMDGAELVLGPFQGKPACLRIPIGRGVCGTAVSERRTQVVDKVHDFEGHIACDSASESEIVIPIIKEEVIYGVLDIDSPITNRFRREEKEYFEKYLEILADKSDFDKLASYYQIRK